jgi:hypothetical protein
MVVNNACSSRRKVLAAALHIHAARAEHGSFLERDLMAGGDTLIEADAEIAGLAAQNNALRAALERADAKLNESDEGAKTRRDHKAKLVDTRRF